MDSELQVRPAPTGLIVAATSREIVRLYARLLGRGPTRARTHFHDDYLVCVLEDIFTRAEQTLIGAGRGSQVVEMRQSLHEQMRPELIQIVEEQTGRAVRLAIAQVDADADVALEFFSFEPYGVAPLDPRGARHDG